MASMSSASGVWAGEAFKTLKLPTGISVEIPVDWEMLSDLERSEVASRAMGILGRAGLDNESDGKVTLLALNSNSTPIGAKFRISSTPKSSFSADDLAALTQADFDYLKAQMLEGFQQAERAGGVRVIEISTIDRTNLDGQPSLASIYRRGSIGDSSDIWTVMTIKTPLTGRLVETTVSWRVSETQRWYPLAKRLVGSIKFPQ